jgi:hypothetical protein
VCARLAHMSLLIALISAAALNADPALAGGPDAYYGEAAAYQPARSPYDAPYQGRQPYRLYDVHHQARQPYIVHDDAYDAAYAGHAPASEYGHTPAPRTVQLSPGFFHGSLTGGVERPPVLFFPVRHGYVIHHAPSGPVSAGQAAAARGLGQGASR